MIFVCAGTLHLFYIININNIILRHNYAHVNSGAFSLDMSIYCRNERTCFCKYRLSVGYSETAHMHRLV